MSNKVNSEKKGPFILSGQHIALGLFVAIAGFFLWTEHKAHLLGALPYLILLLCPLMHVFMHRGHGGHDRHDVQQGNSGHHHDKGGP